MVTVAVAVTVIVTHNAINYFRDEFKQFDQMHPWAYRMGPVATGLRRARIRLSEVQPGTVGPHSEGATKDSAKGWLRTVHATVNQSRYWNTQGNYVSQTQFQTIELIRTCAPGAYRMGPQGLRIRGITTGAHSPVGCDRARECWPAHHR